MIFGFTGTRKGMTPRQAATVKYLFTHGGVTILHHGGERHADAQAHQLALELGVSVRVHPGPAFDIAKDCLGADLVYETRPNLARNGDIAIMGVDGLIAAPHEFAEVLRSGTWSTVRRARKLKRRVWLAFPDGTIREEHP